MKPTATDGAPTLRLRPTRAADLAFVVAAERDDDNREWLLPWSEAQHRASLDDAAVRHLIAESADAHAVGFAILAGVGGEHRSVELRRVVVTDKGRGFGRAFVRALLALAFDDLGAHRLWLDTQVRNARARHLYATEGFVEEGVLRECWRQHGAWQSLVVMSVLAREYRSRRAGEGAGALPGG